MTTTFSSVFVSHGAPTLAVEPEPAHDFLAGLGTTLGRPRAVLCVSAHWETDQPALTANDRPATIHDFSGFPAELYALRYPAPGDGTLAARAAGLLAGASIEASLDATRGLDHGAWVPLSLVYPDAGVPVVQLSVQPHRDAAHHLAVGRALQPLRDEGVLVLGSGGATHNLGEVEWGDDPSPSVHVRDFERWLVAAVTSGSVDELVGWRERAPDAARIHPTTEHFMPLFVALGAAGASTRATVLHRSFAYRVLAMAAFAWPAA
ncbi:MAG: dioxygenase [Acidobacteria bacterium]|nr:dioxygenase [Acidobacteriota bacterium]